MVSRNEPALSNPAALASEIRWTWLPWIESLETRTHRGHQRKDRGGSARLTEDDDARVLVVATISVRH